MRHMISLTTVAVATALGLLGCSMSPSKEPLPTVAASSTASPTAEQTPATYELNQTFTATTSFGATLTVELPAAGPDDIEQLRTDLKVEPVSYAKVHIDNRKGTEEVSVYLVTIYDENGTAYEFQDLSVYHVADWGPHYTDALGGVEGTYGYTLTDGTILDETVGDDLSRRSTTLQNQYLNATNASKLEVSTGWLASTTTKLPERITGITIQPQGLGDEVPMTPGGTMPTASASPAPTEQQPDGSGTIPADDPQSEPGPPETEHPEPNPEDKFTYEEALAALEGGMPYYEAFCIRYDPVTDGGRSQCEGIEAGTVDPITGEYIGD
ncbi:hypothetical protein GC088_03340 [Arthrobacter sp. JZ12]|uniref:hypothetical protein n=1 Tax=Arthrobacter sp. JZ12 TaxID=2654190 RepID=UPI002B46C440|nr:hypothetical protein [Arthrobacter sp. JZ12]WRH24222.1 hypothetical protein GC088_03340 [Arthrobacter sp. JZ12]